MRGEVWGRGPSYEWPVTSVGLHAFEWQMETTRCHAEFISWEREPCEQVRLIFLVRLTFRVLLIPCCVLFPVVIEFGVVASSMLWNLGPLLREVFPVERFSPTVCCSHCVLPLWCFVSWVSLGRFPNWAKCLGWGIKGKELSKGPFGRRWSLPRGKEITEGLCGEKGIPYPYSDSRAESWCQGNIWCQGGIVEGLSKRAQLRPGGFMNLARGWPCAQR